MLEPEHRFIWHLFNKYGISDFDDPRLKIKESDPVLWTWMLYSWAEDQNDKVELLKSHGYLVASFINPDEVRRILDTNNTHASDEKEFEESLKIVKSGKLEISEELSRVLNTGSKRPNIINNNEDEDSNKRRRRRRIIK